MKISNELLNTYNSYIRTGGFIKEKHPHADIYIYGYSNLKSNNIFWDELNINLRGLILNGNGEVVARGFKKFFTYKSYLSNKKVLLSNNRLFDVPNSNYKIFEKIDGTFTVLYWINDEPYLASQRSFVGPKVIKANQILKTKYSHCISKLKKDRTYLFEAVYPETRVIVDYDNEEKLYLIGVVENSTGLILPLEDIGFPLPYDYTEDFSGVNDFNLLQSLNMHNKEGFVVIFENGSMFKIKLDWYKSIHKLIDLLISYQKQSYLLTQRIKAQLNIEPKVLTKEIVINNFEIGKLSEVILNIPPALYLYGVEEWIEEVIDSKINKTNIEKKDFDSVFEFGKSTKYNDNIMWNFYKRNYNCFD